MRIAVDAMGGDLAPRTIVDGALVAARHLGIGLWLVGRREDIERELARHRDHPALDLELADCPDVIEMAESPAEALRRKPSASVKVAADLVARGVAGGFFSAGNTGATLMAAHAAFGMLPDVQRPALATTIPTRTGSAVLLDSGANARCRASHLVQFARMGVAYATVALGIEAPRVGLLSIGEEESKGTDLTREAHRLLKLAPVDFRGNVEPRDVFLGDVDVIICDGFTGNVVLKTSEGLVEMVEHLLSSELSRTFGQRVGFLLSQRAFRRFRRRIDYSEYGGAPLLGVAGLCIVGHGRSSAKAVRNAVALTARFSNQSLVERVQRMTT